MKKEKTVLDDRTKADLDILEDAIEEYFQPAIQAATQPFVVQAITEAKWNLLNRLRNKITS
jgi:hypothetical protein